MESWLSSAGAEFYFGLAIRNQGTYFPELFSMQIISQPAAWERRRPLVLAFLCFVFAAWFAWDGWYGWPDHDDTVVQQMLLSHRVTGKDKLIARAWPGWRHATNAQRLKFDHLVHINNIPGWHTVTDIHNQRWIVLGLGLVAVAGLVWFLWVRFKRIMADDQGLWLSNGRMVPYNAIKMIDNRRWPKAGLVILEYVNAAGRVQHAVLDAVIYENLPPLLNEVIARATAAEVINPPAAATATENNSAGSGRS
jgi:hypothetical protein